MCSTPGCEKPSWNHEPGEYCSRACRNGPHQAMPLRWRCPLCDGAGAFPDDEEDEQNGAWPETPTIQGRGRHEGCPPRCAGIIAVCSINQTSFVCLCEKKNGNTSYPKGGLDGDTVLVGAKREWSEEAGISMSRLRLLRGGFLDEPRIGCRYLLARCAPPDPNSDEPDAGSTEWTPPMEDANDLDCIAIARWVPVSDVVKGRSRLKDDRAQKLKKAIEQLDAGDDFIDA